MEIFNYTTSQGETWASIAWKMYGTMAGIQAIISANQLVPIDPILPYGTILQIPILDDVDSNIIRKNLPLWK